jgi:integrase/recombinase XerD
VFFDPETAMILKRWLNKRETIAKEGCKALFVSYDTGERLNRSGVYNAFIKWAVQAGLHDPHSKRIEDHFTPHCGRHYFTTQLRRAGMQRGFIQELRGDARDGAIDVYDHIDEEELRKSYIALIPQLGIE